MPAKHLSKPVRDLASHKETPITIENEIGLKLRRPERETSAEHSRRRYGESGGIGADKLYHKLTIKGFKSRGTSGGGGGEIAGGESRGRAHDLEIKKTNNTLRDKTCPGVDVARCRGKESAVEQGSPGRQSKMGQTRARTWCSCPFKENSNRKQEKNERSHAKIISPGKSNARESCSSCPCWIFSTSNTKSPHLH